MSPFVVHWNLTENQVLKKIEPPIDIIEVKGATVFPEYNGIFYESGILNNEKYFSKSTSGRNENLYIFHQNGLWKFSRELGSTGADYYTSSITEKSDWFAFTGKETNM